jgi:hypothetical protein
MRSLSQAFVAAGRFRQAVVVAALAGLVFIAWHGFDAISSIRTPGAEPPQPDTVAIAAAKAAEEAALTRSQAAEAANATAEQTCAASHNTDDLRWTTCVNAAKDAQDRAYAEWSSLSNEEFALENVGWTHDEWVAARTAYFSALGQVAEQAAKEVFGLLVGAVCVWLILPGAKVLRQ